MASLVVNRVSLSMKDKYSVPYGSDVHSSKMRAHSHQDPYEIICSSSICDSIKQGTTEVFTNGGVSEQTRKPSCD